MKIPAIIDLSIQDFRENARLNRDVIRAIDTGLTQYNEQTRPDPAAAPLVLAVRENDRVRAGIIGRSAYGWMRIDIIWVDASLRGKGYGQALMHRAEEVATTRGCRGIHLDTHGFQAPAFYLKLGYQIFGELPDYPTGESHYYLRKFLV